MTTIAAGRLSDTLQSLVDARLDTIDRMLLGRVNRHDRLAIVREVETQIFDLLEGRNTENLDRDDVLAVLARLDPPEAYLQDEATGEVREVRIPRSSPSIASRTERKSWLPLTSGLLGIVSVVMVLFSELLTLIFAEADSPIEYFLVFGSLGMTFILGLLAVILAGRVKIQGGWPITGLVTGILSMLGMISGTLFILSQL